MKRTEENNALEICSVTKHYPLFTLDAVSLNVPRGTIMGLIGENGAGKTTTLKLLLGIIRADNGTVTLLDKSEPSEMQRVKEKVGVVLDEGFFPAAFTLAQVELVCRNIYKTWERESFGTWLQRFSLPDKKKISELSKGMKMKLAIAIALSHGAELLILDEATSGLDPIVRSEMMDVFLDFMQDDRHAILFSTHITTDLEKIADAITFIHRGKVVFSKNKDTLLEQYGLLRCGEAEYEALAPSLVAGKRDGAYGHEVLIIDREGYRRTHPDAVLDPATLDDIMLFTIKGE